MKKALAQYMTPGLIAQFMIGLIQGDKNSKVLEPSSGEGIFIQQLLREGYTDITAYEIDEAIIETNPVTKKHVKNKSFVSTAFKSRFDLVIGNPPYIRWKNLSEDLKEELVENELYQDHLNAFADYSAVFILNSIEALKEGGELIFITPDHWLNSTRSKMLRDYMMKNGQFSEIYLFKEAKVFADANISLMVFRYVKTQENPYPKIKIRTYPKRLIDQETLNTLHHSEANEANYEIVQFKLGAPWRIYNQRVVQVIAQLEEACGKDPVLLGDICAIGNGMVSGLDKAFRLEASEYDKLSPLEKEHTLAVLKGKDMEGFWYQELTSYLFIQEVDDSKEIPRNYPVFYKKLLPYHEQLAKRYSYNREIYYWQWAFLRNYALFQQETEKIFVPGKDRISHKNHFRFTIVPPRIYPTQDATALILKESTLESIEYVTAYLNSQWVFEWLKNNGVTKGHIVEFTKRPVSLIPFLAINFQDAFERTVHNKIMWIVRLGIESKDPTIKSQVDELFDELIDYRLDLL